jgi:hypothetical protein
MTAVTRKIHSFVFELSGANELTAEIADAVSDAGCDDAFLYCRDGTLYIDFSREAETLLDAVASAASDVGNAGCGLRVARVETEPDLTERAN